MMSIEGTDFDPLDPQVLAEAARHETEERAAMRDEYPDADGKDAAQKLRIYPRLTRAEMANQTVEFLCPRARFLPRGVATLVTSAGGVGKSRFFLQLAEALATGATPFGCEYLTPDRPQVVLYIGAEDRAPFFHSLATPLLGSDDATLSFDVLLLPEVRPGFTLSRSTVRELGAFLSDHRDQQGGLDLVILDPMVAIIGTEYADMIKNPLVSRAFFNDCLQPLFAGHDFALLTGNHDSKNGAAVTGSADQQNSARAVLQFTSADPKGDGTLPVVGERIKDNCGFRFRKFALVRDPETLLLTWDGAASTYAYGAPDSVTARQSATPPRDPTAVRRYLARQAARLLQPTEAPESKRAKSSVEALLVAEAARDGLGKAKMTVRSFLDGFCEFERRKDRRTWRHVLVGVRNPDAAIDEHDDFIAGRAACVDTGHGPNEGDAE